MNKWLSIFKNLFFLFFVVGLVYVLSNYGGMVEDKVLFLTHLSKTDVQGASTQRAKEIQKQVGSDVSQQAQDLQKQAMQVKVGDILQFLGRAQRIPQDAIGIESFVQQQVNSVLPKGK